MTNVLLGIIAVAVLVMAAIQVAAIVFAVSAARRIGQVADRLEQNLSPVVSNLQTITSEAARMSTLAAAQVERAADGPSTRPASRRDSLGMSPPLSRGVVPGEAEGRRRGAPGLPGGSTR